jgi:RimJ/RimL family protein N-acetyltransferase
MVAAVSIRPLLPGDWQLYRTIRLQALQTDPRCFSSTFARENANADQKWQNQLDNPDVGTFGLFCDQNIIGLTGIGIKRDDLTKRWARLWGSWIAPAHRGCGYSDLLYTARLDWARAHPTIEWIEVSHRDGNEASRRANQRHGFLFTHRTPYAWADGGKEDEIFYQLRVKNDER